MIRMPALWIAALVALPVQAQTTPSTQAVAPQASEPLKARIAELPAILRGEADYDAYFSPAFRQQVPKASFDQMNAQLTASSGPVSGIESVTPTSPDSATLMLGFHHMVATVAIAIDAAPPHQVTGLRITGMSARETSLAAILETLSTLPGSTGFALARLESTGPEMLARQQAERPLAIGSAFKLIILAELVRATNAGERKWDDKVTLAGELLPAGVYMLQPKGTQVSLRELALKMISVSDNSATDILIGALGRERIEAMLPVVGIADPKGMRPFLTTMELFKLKGIRKGELGRRWAGLDEAGRRAMLPALAAEPALAIEDAVFRTGKPVMIDTIEWFATPADLVRVMDWLRRNSESGPGAEARAILSASPGLPPQVASRWGFVGYKGGSETGVISLTWLLQGKDGSWHALSASWTDGGAAVDNARFAGLIGRAAELAAP